MNQLLCRRSAAQRASAFTLIELLVVIAIIAILAAILFPVFARARENARRSSCQSNLKQMALGIIQYQQDYDEKFVNIVTPAALGPAFGWGGGIQPYLKSSQVFHCPSASGDKSDSVSSENYSDYGMNRLLNTVTGSLTIPAGGLPIAAVRFPSQTVMLVDVRTGTARNNLNGCNNGWDSNSLIGGGIATGCDPTAVLAKSQALLPESSGGTEARRHLEGQNFAFVDGHVKWFKSSGRSLSASNYRFMENVFMGDVGIGETSSAGSGSQTVVYGFGL